jgi:PadR family transcriptional regulator PadR
MGAFEMAVLTAVVRLGTDAYGRRIHKELETKLRRTIPIAQVYVALARLDQKGFLSSRSSDPIPERGGRSRRVYSVTGLGETRRHEAMTQWELAVDVWPSAKEA